MDKKKVALVSIGHFATDINHGALPAALPFLRDSLNLTYQATGGLMFAFSIISAITQPFFGLLTDRFQKPWLIPLGIILAGVGFGITGLLPSYWAVFAAVGITGLGSAIFHPPGARLANQVGGRQKGLALSLFSIGGNTGFVLGPMLAAFILPRFGVQGTSFFIILAVIMASAFCIFLLKSRDTAAGAAGRKKGSTEAPNNWNQFGRISIVICARASVLTGVMTYMPLYLMHYFDWTKAQGGLTVTLLGAAGVISNVCGGFLSDRLGYGRILHMAFTPLPFLLLALAFTQSIWLIWLLIPCMGFCLYFAYGSMVVLGQQFLASNIGFASGVTMGLATTVGGLCSPILGWIGDEWGLQNSILTMVGIAVVGMAISFLVDPTVNAESAEAAEPAEGGSEKA